MARPTVRIHHEGLDRTVEVPPSTARVLARSGWIPAPNPEPDIDPDDRPVFGPPAPTDPPPEGATTITED